MNVDSEKVQQSGEMVTRDDDATLVNPTATESKILMRDWSVEDVHKEFIGFINLAKIWLEIKGVLVHKQYILCLHL